VTKDPKSKSNKWEKISTVFSSASEVEKKKTKKEL